MGDCREVAVEDLHAEAKEIELKLPDEDSPPVSVDVVGPPSLRLWTVVYSVLTTCLLALMVGTTISFSSPALLQLEQLDDPQLHLNTELSDLFGVSDRIIICGYKIIVRYQDLGIYPCRNMRAPCPERSEGATKLCVINE